MRIRKIHGIREATRQYAITLCGLFVLKPFVQITTKKIPLTCQNCRRSKSGRFSTDRLIP